MPQYLMSLEELYKHAIQKLGPMDQENYRSYMERAIKLTANPLLVIDIKFNQHYRSQGMRDQPYPISEIEWQRFIDDAKTMAEYCPNVYVVDGSKFTAPI